MNGPPAFAFLQSTARTPKPRGRSGLTVASDHSLSLEEARNLLETRGDVIDHVKMPDHVGLLWRWDPDWIRRKNTLYRDAGIPTLPGGVPFEVAAVQGKVAEYMARVADLGFEGVEVSEDSIDLRPEDRLASIRCAARAGLRVFTEVGKKLPRQPLDWRATAEMARRDLDAGAWLVVVEKSDVALVKRDGTDAVHRLVDAVGRENLVIECGPGSDRLEIARWLIEQFGPDVNLENVDAEEVHVLEAMRRGLNRAVDYSYFHPYHGKPLPAVGG